MLPRANWERKLVNYARHPLGYSKVNNLQVAMLVDEAIFPCRYRMTWQQVAVGAANLAFEIKICYPSLMEEPHQRKTSADDARAMALISDIHTKLHEAHGSKASMIDAE